MLNIDGSRGEGGGQVLRTSLALSLVTGAPVRIANIRANREKPGLRRQHLTALKAAAAVGRAETTGAAVGAREITFRPRGVEPGEYTFSVGTAGSATLVLQTVLPALLTASGPSRLALEGGTHNMMAPPFDFIERAFLPIVNRLGPEVRARLERHGFYPAGGGLIHVDVTPCERLGRVDLLERGALRGIGVRALVSRLPTRIGEKEVRTAARILDLDARRGSVEEVRSAGPGNVVIIDVESEALTEVFTGFGRRGTPAEVVAGSAAREAKAYLDAGAPVGPHLADQLLLPLALAGAGAFRTTEPTLHATTNIGVIREFLPVEIEAAPVDGGVWEVRVAPQGGADLV